MINRRESRESTLELGKGDFILRLSHPFRGLNIKQMSDGKQLLIIWTLAVLSGLACFWYINASINSNIAQKHTESLYDQ